MSATTYLLLNLTLAFYNAGTIWAHEVDIFRTWRLIAPAEFAQVQRDHWRKLPYWVFAPVGLALIGGVGLIWVHPAGFPPWALFGALASQGLSLVLTAGFWGRWQAKLSRNPLGPESPYLKRILRTHWVRTLLISAYGLFLLAGTVSWLG